MSIAGERIEDGGKKEGIDAWYMVSDIVITSVTGKRCEYRSNDRVKLF